MSEQIVRNAATQISNFSARVRNLSGENNLHTTLVRHEIESLALGLENEAKKLSLLADQIKAQVEPEDEPETVEAGQAKKNKK